MNPRYRPISCALKGDRHGARAFLSALWSELALQNFDVGLIAGVAQLPEGVRAWALEALKRARRVPLALPKRIAPPTRCPSTTTRACISSATTPPPARRGRARKESLPA